MNLPSRMSRIALALGIGLAPVLAQQPEKLPAPRPPHPGKALRDEAMSKRLKLTEAQKKAIEAIRAKHEEAMKPKFQAEKDAQKAFHEALAKTDTTPDQLRALHKTASDAQFEVLLAHRALRKEIHDQLTSEQREEAARMEGFWMGRGQRGFGGPGFGAEGHGFGPEGHRGFKPGAPPTAPDSPAKPEATK